MRSMIALAAIALLSSASPPLPAAARAYIRDVLRAETYASAQADLNGDKALEVFVYATGRETCGSGGCNLYVLSPKGAGYRVVLRASVAQAPIRRLASGTRGWRDIGVFVSGGGAKPREARLRFNGEHYPGNPSMAPASGNPPGEILIPDTP
ncbi:hypothetical protein [Caulobacter segnis]|uniref:hypothetical protein n=1 Tax=Caulobacter segnis TaxID=88688 RepID=UPI00285F5B13|nr:hypothetical protein [Caulobacter segnis]MDR6627895.1 hypothetical protein [Caulobacter segnis]